MKIGTFITLHSTMYLFLLISYNHMTVCVCLYIPQCIYFYNKSQYIRLEAVILYIPQCIYFYFIYSLIQFLCSFFTFHNVSISTTLPCSELNKHGTLHSTMYLFLHALALASIGAILSLHSTMYLFLPTPFTNTTFASIFTFHNVSISTHPAPPVRFQVHPFTFHNVSISTCKIRQWTIAFAIFTFHNVSISTLIQSSH